jgi:hypothetical protein
MRKLLLSALAASALAAISVSPAAASGGCGPYMHRTWAGFCRPPGQLGWGPGGYAYGYGYRPYYAYGPGWRWRHWRRWRYY